MAQRTKFYCDFCDAETPKDELVVSNAILHSGRRGTFGTNAFDLDGAELCQTCHAELLNAAAPFAEYLRKQKHTEGAAHE